MVQKLPAGHEYGDYYSQDSQSFVFLKDHQNSVTGLLDSEGNLVESYEYSAFGTIRSIKDAAGIVVPEGQLPNRSYFSYTGREYEPETGLYYYRARYYDSTTGRFLQKDSDPGTLTDPRTILNKYVYCANNPVMYTDPSGKIFGWDDLLYIILISLSKTAVENNQNGGNFMDQWGKNFIVTTVFYVGGAWLGGGSTFDSSGNLMGVLEQWGRGSLTEILVGGSLRKWENDKGINKDQNFGIQLTLGLGYSGYLTYNNDFSYSKNFFSLITNGGYVPNSGPSTIPSPVPQQVPSSSRIGDTQ